MKGNCYIYTSTIAQGVISKEKIKQRKQKRCANLRGKNVKFLRRAQEKGESRKAKLGPALGLEEGIQRDKASEKDHVSIMAGSSQEQW